jgi:hypothetical protein
MATKTKNPTPASIAAKKRYDEAQAKLKATKQADNATLNDLSPATIPEAVTTVTGDSVTLDDDAKVIAAMVGRSGGSNKELRGRLISWNDLINAIHNPLQNTPKLDAPYFVCSNLLDRSANEQKEKGSFDVIKSDLDGHTNLLELNKVLAALDCKTIAYSTYSATPECNKWRVVTKLATPVDAETFTHLSAILNDKLEAAGITPDRSSEKPSQISFLPNEGAFYEKLLGHNTRHPLNFKTRWGNELAAKREQARIKQAEAIERAEKKRLETAEKLNAGIITSYDAFNATYSVETMLEKYGYIYRYRNRWLSPNSKSGNAGVTVDGDKWFSSHESDAEIGAFSNGRAFGNAFDLFVYYEHGNDRKKALKAAGDMFFTPEGITLNEAYKQANDTLPLNHTLYGQKNGVITVAELLDPISTQHYAKDKFLHPLKAAGTDYCFSLQQTYPKGSNYHDYEKNGIWEWFLEHDTNKKLFFYLEQLPVPEVEPAPIKARNKLTPVNVLTKQDIKVNWLVDKLIPESGVILAFGDPESAKSLWVQGMGYCIATGRSFDGRTVKQTKVVNYIGEGAEGLQPRYKALELLHGVETDKLFNSEDPAQFMDATYTDAIIQDLLELGGVGLVCIDTLHRNFGNGDENSSKDFGLFMNNIDRLRKTVGCAVIIIHHSGHSEKTRSRGSSSIRASLDAEFCVTKKGDYVTITCEKMKNFSRTKMNLPLNYKLKEIQLDAENSSVILEPTDYSTIKQPANSATPRDYEILEHIKTALAVHGKPPLKLIPEWLGEQPTMVLSLSDLRTFICETELITDKGSIRTGLKRALPRLETAGYVGFTDNFVWCTE